MAAKKKLTLYLPDKLLEEAKREALRQDRSISWILHCAWRIARPEIAGYPSIDHLVTGDPAATEA